MKILRTEIYRFSIGMEPFTIATGTMHFAQNVLVKVYTDTGLFGLGECSAFPMIVGETQDTCLVMARDFAGIWKGKDAGKIEERLGELDDWCARNTTIKSAFDMALYDLAAKAENLPLYKYFGAHKKQVETDITVGIGAPEVMAQTALNFKERGATMLKVKLGKDAATDPVRIEKIRDAVGPAVSIRIDANQGWSYEEAVHVLRAIEKYDILFCEQPMRYYDDARLPFLRNATTIKIMADESVYNHYDAERLIQAGACDYINIKLSKSGGMNEAFRILKTASAAGIPCMMGGMLESRLALSATLHFVYANPGIVFYDMDTCMLGHVEDPVTGGVIFNGFFLDIADTPGIGADVSFDFLDKCEKWIV